ncbi:MAG TPA: hypothetical protein VI669_15795 [Vicinamibacteria bacterium]
MIVRRALAAAIALLALHPAASADVQVRVPKPKRPPSGPSRLQGIAVATLAYAAGPLRREAAGARSASPLNPGEFVRTGDFVRTGAEGVARFAFPWMSVTASPHTTLHIPSEVILSVVLEEGRAEVSAAGGDILKIRTAEAEVRGAGRVVVRRDPKRQALVVTAREGTFRVEGSGKAVVLLAGEGTVVRKGSPPEPARRLPPAPTDLRPGQDPIYVVKGEAASLSWRQAGATHHLEVLPLESGDVLLERDVGVGPEEMTIPWLGTYRWRVAARDALGLESLPSVEGLICVVEK